MPKAESKTTAKRAAKAAPKKKKDPNAPKRGLSAYMFFANDMRETVREENPGISFGMRPVLCPLPQSTDASTGQVGKQLGERWKALNEKQRIPYEAKAAQDKKRYEDEKASYNVSADEPVGVRKGTRGANKNVAQADAEEDEEE